MLILVNNFKFNNNKNNSITFEILLTIMTDMPLLKGKHKYCSITKTFKYVRIFIRMRIVACSNQYFRDV